MTAVTLRVHEVQLFERHVTLRLPFRFGAATVTQCPQAFARVLAEVDGRRVEGASAELMVNFRPVASTVCTLRPLSRTILASASEAALMPRRFWQDSMLLASSRNLLELLCASGQFWASSNKRSAAR